MGFFLSFEGEGHGIKKCGIKPYLFFPWQDGMEDKDGVFMILYLERTMST